MAERSLEDRRPSPKALLGLAAKERRGKLKVFLGMAPGVGKTYAMLSAARAAKADGIDVVVGIVETHGRAETAALLHDLEVLPRKEVVYRKRTLTEFDIEAAIARQPTLLLVDEFAHTNAPGMLHAKRYQDVEEALRNGIDVWTTVNVQHLESLGDVVQQITGVTVRETVPDRVLEDADEIVVIDLPPEELIQRLKEGKVYLPENAQRAVDQFFKVSNLTALRELALRRTADRVDGQMRDQLRQQGIEGPWPTAERLLVCVGADEQSETVVRAAARMAAALKSDWVAIHVRRSDREVTDRSKLRRTDRAMRLAERLGASTTRLSAADLTNEILSYARRNNITQIVMGRSQPIGLDWLRGRSLSNELLANARGISVTILAPTAEAPRRLQMKWPTRSRLALAGTAALLAVSVAVLIGSLLESIMAFPNLSMVFLFAVLVCALGSGLTSAIAAAVLSFLAYNFFFIEPRYTFTIAQPYELFSLLIFLLVAIATGGLAARLREQADATRERAEATQALYDFSRKLSGAAKLDDVLWLLASNVSATIKGKSILLMPRDGDLSIVGSWPPEDTLPDADWAAARWAMREREPAGRSTGTLPTSRFQFRPLLGTQGVLAVVGVEPDEREDILADSTEAALQSMLEQAAIAIERTALVEEAGERQSATESENARSALLASLSQDIESPLSSILTAAASLRSRGDRMQRSERTDLVTTIESEAARLSRFVANLLELTRIETAQDETKHETIDVGTVVRATIAQAEKDYPRRRIRVMMPDKLPFIRGDAELLERALGNLLDNAHQYAPPSSITAVDVRADGQVVSIEVSDDGDGIPRAALAQLFEKPSGRDALNEKPPRRGLGLLISAAAVRAMGGGIAAESPIRGGRGTRMTITLPTVSKEGVMASTDAKSDDADASKVAT
jgi:two-component system sensor histidine kinase KdpD